MRHAPDAPLAVLSPHLDDAVLCAFTVLAGPHEAVVVNVCDGIPAPAPVPPAIELCRGTDAAAHVRRRHAEDRKALAQVGRAALGLGFLDADGRAVAPTAEEVREALGRAVPETAGLLAPVGMGSHSDHLLVRDAALAAAAAYGLPAALYADIPYATRYGWPDWVTGDPPDPNLDPGVVWRRALARVPAPLGEAVVERLDDELLGAKRRAVHTYESQLSMLAGGPNGRLADWALRYEVRWPIATP